MRLRSERIVCPYGVVGGEVVVESGRIASVGPPADETAEEIIELGDRWLVPGYIDTHVHGGGGAQSNSHEPEEIAELASFHARHGTTGLLATPASAPVDELCATLAAISRCTAPNLLGAHLEGPFLSVGRPGAMDPGTFLDPDLGPLERLLGAGAGTVRVMTLAPELPGAIGVIEALVAAGVVASIGHTSATDDVVRLAAGAGATAATHVFNAMPPFHHRDPGAVGAVLDLPGVSCEVVCDGVHVDPVAMRLLYRAKGVSGTRLVTDAGAAAGMPDGEYRLAGRAVIATKGRVVLAGTDALAGSALTMEAAVQNAIRFLEVSVEEAVQMSSANPARMLGMHGRKGAIKPGLDADLLVLDPQLAVQATMISGRWLFGPP